MKKTLVLLVLNGIILSLVLIFVISCNLLLFQKEKDIVPLVGGSNSNIGRVSNNFGTLLGRDIDGDGDYDAAAIFSNIYNVDVINGRDIANSMFMDSIGRIYITGETWNGNYLSVYVMRLDNNGILDNSFGTNGKVIFNSIDGVYEVGGANSLYIDSNDKIYVTGESYNGSNWDVYVIRLNGNGSLDNTFSGDGKVLFDSIAFGNDDDFGKSLYVDNNGRIYVTGYSYNGTNLDMYVIRLSSNGSLDNTFDSDGKVFINNIAGSDSVDVGNSIYVDSNGKVYVTGRSYNGSNYDMYVIRLNSDGSLDNSFGNNGKVIFNSIAGGDGDDLANSIYVDSSGKIFVTGESSNGGDYDVYVMRLNSDGSLDNSFGNNGKVIFNNIAGGDGMDYVKDLFVDYTGGIYITGDSPNIDGNSDGYLIRLNSDGTLDNSFGNNGKIILNNIAYPNSFDFANSLYVNSIGKIFITGCSGEAVPANIVNSISNDLQNLDVFVLQIE